MASSAQQGKAIAWFTTADLDAMVQPVADAGCWCRVLVADLRDARLGALLKPVPLESDYADERRKATGDRDFFLARRAVHRSLVAALAGCDAATVRIRYDADGAPRVASHREYFVSVAGHGPLALLAIANCPAGVDFERLDDSTEVVTDVLHYDEQQRLSSSSKREKAKQFLCIWTAKEAFLKARGRGFLDDPAQICIALRDDAFSVAGSDQDADASNVMQGALAVHDLAGARFQCAAAILLSAG